MDDCEGFNWGRDDQPEDHWVPINYYCPECGAVTDDPKKGAHKRTCSHVTVGSES